MSAAGAEGQPGDLARSRLSWQITPRTLIDAMMTMRKIDVATIGRGK